MKENIVDFFSRLFLNFIGFLIVLILSFFMPFILILDLIKYIILNKQTKKERRSVVSLSVKELLVSLGTLILFFAFCYFDKKFWYLFFTLPILLGLLETMREVIFKKQETILDILDPPTLCGTPFIQMEEKQGINEIKLPPETTGVFIEGNDEKKMTKENSEKIMEEIRRVFKK